jgi:hypothetical protein
MPGVWATRARDFHRAMINRSQDLGLALSIQRLRTLCFNFNSPTSCGGVIVFGLLSSDLIVLALERIDQQSQEKSQQDEISDNDDLKMIFKIYMI